MQIGINIILNKMIEYIGWFHIQSFEVITSTKYNLKLTPVVDSSVLKYKKDVTTTWQKRRWKKHKSNLVKKK